MDTGDEQEIFVRSAEQSDLDAWTGLRALLWPHYAKDELRVDAQRFFDEPEPYLHHVLVSELDGRVNGMIEVSLRPYAEGAEASPVPFIEGWYVAEDVRGCGVGAALLETAQELLREEGFTELCSDAALDNEEGQAAHAALGFAEVERTVAFRKAL